MDSSNQTIRTSTQPAEAGRIRQLLDDKKYDEARQLIAETLEKAQAHTGSGLLAITEGFLQTSNEQMEEYLVHLRAQTKELLELETAGQDVSDVKGLSDIRKQLSAE